MFEKSISYYIQGFKIIEIFSNIYMKNKKGHSKKNETNRRLDKAGDRSSKLKLRSEESENLSKPVRMAKSKNKE